MDIKKIKTLGELKAAGYKPKSIKKRYGRTLSSNYRTRKILSRELWAMKTV